MHVVLMDGKRVIKVSADAEIVARTAAMMLEEQEKLLLERGIRAARENREGKEKQEAE